jgi:hypothetical protein
MPNKMLTDIWRSNYGAKPEGQIVPLDGNLENSNINNLVDVMVMPEVLQDLDHETSSTILFTSNGFGPVALDFDHYEMVIFGWFLNSELAESVL